MVYSQGLLYKGRVDGMAELLKIAICEDEITERDKLLKILDESNTRNIYSVFENGEELLAVFDCGNFDLILMDIYMNASMTGVETVKKIREKDKNIPIAFVTTSKEHALESYRLSALKYIEKPYSKESIEDILHLALLTKQDAPSFLVQRNGETERVPFADILYLEQQKHKVFICLKNGESFSVYDKISELHNRLPKHLFFSPHKSFSVNLAFVRYIDIELKCFVMENNVNVPIRRELLNKSKNILEEYLFDRTRGLMR